MPPSYDVNYQNVSESYSFEPLPDGDYTVEIKAIEEKVSKNGRPLIKVRYEVDFGTFRGRRIFDQVTIFNGDEPGAGITKHFLHVISEPHEGAFRVTPDNWIGRKLVVKVKIDPKWNNNKVVSRDFAESIPF